MGLDIVIFHKENKKEIIEIEESLHYWIFNSSGIDIYRFKEIAKIKDYYLTYAKFEGEALIKFIEELKTLNHYEIEKIITKISHHTVEKIMIGGDWFVWSTDYDIYGGLRNLKGDREFIPFRQLGQYEDEETGLYYNRFRYYSPETGAYISQDPISILGGLNVYAYVKDTNRFVDIFGLNELLYRMRLQVQTGSKNIVSRAIQSKEPITAELFSEEMKNMINDLKKVRKDLVDKTEKVALKISKKVQALANTGNGISSTGNILREKFEGKKGEFIRLDVENLEGVNLIKCT